jgi:hypothetical protein
MTSPKVRPGAKHQSERRLLEKMTDEEIKAHVQKTIHAPCVERLQAAEADRDHWRKRAEEAEKVCRLAADMLPGEHYEWCDRRVGLAMRREIPPPECDCGLLDFKVALSVWRSTVGGEGG